ncbi:MAG: hypothetical protein H6622_15205 [Halobacteriovoraceae bacterium]|nr:hypothetical protein [Halobacteriovoraceae bacterium]
MFFLRALLFYLFISSTQAIEITSTLNRCESIMNAVVPKFVMDKVLKNTFLLSVNEIEDSLFLSIFFWDVIEAKSKNGQAIEQSDILREFKRLSFLFPREHRGLDFKNRVENISNIFFTKILNSTHFRKYLSSEKQYNLLVLIQSKKIRLTHFIRSLLTGYEYV